MTSQISLPPSIVARILSYNVASTQDLAILRSVGRVVGRELTSLLPSLTPINTGHWIQSPSKRTNGDSFVNELMTLSGEIDDIWSTASFCAGDRTEEVHSDDIDVFEEAQAVSMLVIHTPTKNLEEVLGDKDSTVVNEQLSSEILQQLKTICEELDQVDSTQDLRDLYESVKEHNLLQPLETDNPTTDSDKAATDMYNYPAMLQLNLPRDAECIADRFESGGATFLKLIANNTRIIDDEDDHGVLTPLLGARNYRGVVVEETDDQYSVHVLLTLQARQYSLWHFVRENWVRNMVYEELWHKHERNSIVEGVAIVDGAVSTTLQKTLQAQIDALAQWQEQNSAVDYHPHSNQVVRDLIHPGIYSYIHGVSPLKKSCAEVPPCIFPLLHNPDRKENEDFWGRAYETSKYQWLPTYFCMSQDGSCEIEDYINNLTPRDAPLNSVLYDSLARLFEAAFPYIESVYSYVRAIRPQLRESHEEVDWEEDPPKPLDVLYVPLRGQKLQVITKVVDYELHPEQTFDGVWHVEGMSHEEIVLTCLYILDRDESIYGADIEFKRAFLRDEAEFIFSTVNQERPRALNDIVEKGLMPLGKVKTLKGRLIVFPNSHVHRVSTMVNRMDEGTGVARRRIVVFFLVNPLHRIVSTREVAPQQVHSGGSLKHEEALNHRLELMKERRLHKQDWNVREIHLCEH